MSQYRRINTGEHLESQKSHYYGIYDAMVEDISDPLSLGRIKVRVYGLHQDADRIPTDSLPWALPCFNYGEFNVPPEGEVVWVMFIQGDIDNPVYLGTYYGINNFPKIKGKLASKAGPGPKPVDSSTRRSSIPEQVPANNSVSYYDPAGNDSPEEAFIYKDLIDPTVHVAFKSPKGATIYCKEDDGGETFVMIDRFGQGLKFSAPVGEKNRNNVARRGIRDAADGTQLPIDTAAGGTTKIRITDGLGQFCEFTANEGKAKIELTGHDSGYMLIEQDGQKITLHSEKGDKGSTVIMDDNIHSTSDGDADTLLDNKGNIFIKTKQGSGGQGATGTFLANGNITVEGSGSIVVRGRDITVESKAGSVVVNSATSISIDAQSTIDITAKAPISIKSDSSISIEGSATVDVKSDGLVNISGTLVSINGV